MRRFLAISGLLLGLLLVAVPGWIVVFSRDLPEVGDADLRVERRPVPAEEDASPLLLAATRRLSLSESDYEALQALVGGEWNAAAADALLLRNASALDHLAQALDRPRLAFAPVRFYEVSPLTSRGSALLILAQLGSLRGIRAAHRGEPAEALEAQLELLRFGKLIETGEGAGLIDMVKGDWLRQIGLDGLFLVLRQVSVDRELARHGIDELQALRPDHAVHARIWAWEWSQLRQGLEAGFPFDGEGPDGSSLAELPWHRRVLAAYMFQPHRTLTAMVDDYRATRDQALRPCHEQDWPEPASDDGEDSIRQKLSYFFLPNGMGRVLADGSPPDFGRFHQGQCRNEARLSVAQAVLALSAHRAERGSLPEGLQDLVPDYLREVPVDPLAGARLRYSRAERLLFAGEERFPIEF